MLRTPILHPGLLAGLAAAGHGALVLVADANFPAGTARGPYAQRVDLALRPGLVSATDAAGAVLATMPVEAAYVMAPMADGPWAAEREPEIWEGFRALLRDAGSDAVLEPVEREAFYELARDPSHALTVVTGEQRLYGNLLLRVGVIAPGPPA